MNKNLLYRSIPKVDILLADEGIKVLIETYSRESGRADGTHLGICQGNGGLL